VTPSSNVRNILLIEAPSAGRTRTRAFLEDAGYRVTEGTHASAAEQIGEGGHDAILAALEWSAADTANRVGTLKQQASALPLFLLCPEDQVDLGVLALRHGADDYLIHPLDAFELETRLDRVLERHDLDSRIAFFQDEVAKRAGFRNMEARSAAMRSVLDRVLRVAPMRSTVLVFGESGVGKELVARSIHFNSPRRNAPFIALNCAAMPASLIESELFGHERGAFTGAYARARGKFEIANRGTLFLDEIAEMEPATQAKVLRALEEKEFMRVGGDRNVRVDVRLIAATNADLDRMTADGRFRQDLYYRLKVVTITVPPLRERREDIPPLVETFLDELSRCNAIPRKRITPEAMVLLTHHTWPGNVRELKNLLESVIVAVRGEEIRPDDLPSSIGQQPASPPEGRYVPGTTLAEMEQDLIRRTLIDTGGNRTHSASLLGIGVRTLQRKIQGYGLDIPPRRRRKQGDRPAS